MYGDDYTKHSLNEITIAYIKDRILSGELKSGDKIAECDISEALGISRAPVREGLRELSTSGLLAFFPRRGSYVLEMSKDELQETFEIRTSLELQVLSILIRNRSLTEDDFAQLTALNEQMSSLEGKEMEPRERLYNLNYLDISFHRYLWRASKSLKRYRLLDDLFFQLLISMNRNVVTLGTFTGKAREHERIRLALKKGSREEVFTEFQNHLREYMTATIPGADWSDLSPSASLFAEAEGYGNAG